MGEIPVSRASAVRLPWNEPALCAKSLRALQTLRGLAWTARSHSLRECKKESK